MALRDDSVRDLVASVLGGAVGALVTKLLVRAGLKPHAASLGTAVAGALAATLTDRSARVAAAGAAAAGAGQLGLIWFASLDRRIEDAAAGGESANAR